METLSKQQIAKALGFDPSLATGLQDWQPDTHIHLVISELVMGDVIVPFRVKNSDTGETHTKLHEDGDHNPAKVDAIFHDEVMVVQHQKNLVLHEAITEAIPDLHAHREAIEVRIGAQLRLADLTDDGRIINVRPVPVMPAFVVEGTKVHVDASAMSAEHQAALTKALAGKARVITAPQKG